MEPTESHKPITVFSYHISEQGIIRAHLSKQVTHQIINITFRNSLLDRIKLLKETIYFLFLILDRNLTVNVLGNTSSE